MNHTSDLMRVTFPRHFISYLHWALFMFLWASPNPFDCLTTDQLKIIGTKFTSQEYCDKTKLFLRTNINKIRLKWNKDHRKHNIVSLPHHKGAVLKSLNKRELQIILVKLVICFSLVTIQLCFLTTMCKLSFSMFRAVPIVGNTSWKGVCSKSNWNGSSRNRNFVATTPRHRDPVCTRVVTKTWLGIVEVTTSQCFWWILWILFWGVLDTECLRFCNEHHSEGVISEIEAGDFPLQTSCELCADTGASISQYWYFMHNTTLNI